mmetsp:Transcript_56146/g.117430  ORF Transcript_56146/g.117430 Transcript_56146/m.117430 type:complete len:203 (+) Transcript_56146:199-807(+)
MPTLLSDRPIRELAARMGRAAEGWFFRRTRNDDAGAVRRTLAPGVGRAVKADVPTLAESVAAFNLHMRPLERARRTRGKYDFSAHVGRVAHERGLAARIHQGLAGIPRYVARYKGLASPPWTTGTCRRAGRIQAFAVRRLLCSSRVICGSITTARQDGANLGTALQLMSRCARTTSSDRDISFGWACSSIRVWTWSNNCWPS